MFHHVVTFKWNAPLTAEQLDHVKKSLASLPTQISCIRSYVFGVDLQLSAGTNSDFAIVATFDSAQDWAIYDQHPVHDQVRIEVLKPLIAERSAVQFIG